MLQGLWYMLLLFIFLRQVLYVLTISLIINKVFIAVILVNVDIVVVVFVIAENSLIYFSSLNVSILIE